MMESCLQGSRTLTYTSQSVSSEVKVQRSLTETTRSPWQQMEVWFYPTLYPKNLVAVPLTKTYYIAVSLFRDRGATIHTHTVEPLGTCNCGILQYIPS